MLQLRIASLGPEVIAVTIALAAHPLLVLVKHPQMTTKTNLLVIGGGAVGNATRSRHARYACLSCTQMHN
jgi:lipoprotein signal peptidase